MSLFHSLCLHIVSTLYSIILLAKCCIPRRTPKPLHASRKLQPKNLALLLHPEGVHDNQEELLKLLVECARRVVLWSAAVGIETVTIYDQDGLLKNRHSLLSNAILRTSAQDTSKPDSVADIRINQQANGHHLVDDMPMTPPPSESDGSSSSTADPLSPPIIFDIDFTPQISNEHVSQKIKLALICQEQGKPSLPRAVQQLAYGRRHQKEGPMPEVDLAKLASLLEADFPEPNLLIIHNVQNTYRTSYSTHFWNRLKLRNPKTLIPAPLELHAFPPWHIRLSEMYYDPMPPSRFFKSLLPNCFRVENSPALLTEVEFRRALDQYATADIKLGK